MNCPNCKSKTEIIKEWDLSVGKNRTRKCTKCGFKFDTYIRADGEHVKTASCIQHICAVCGKKFYGKANQKSCSAECRSQLLHKNHKIRDYDKVQKTKKAKNTINDFIRAQTKAEKAGKHLTYAEWQATH